MKGFFEEQVDALRKAYELEHGVTPVGSAQAALLDYCELLAKSIQTLDARLAAAEAKLPDSASATLVRIEAKLDQMLRAKEKSVFETIFGGNRA